jgi:hypothetical protein
MTAKKILTLSKCNYHGILAASQQIKLFLEMLIFFKNTFLKETFVKGIEESFEIFCNILKLSIKSGKDGTQTPCLVT